MVHNSRSDQRIAVVGCGVAGLTAGWLLSRKHDVHLFEKNDYLGGHTRTLTIQDGPDAGKLVDTGFIVMNHRNYPKFTEVLAQLEVTLEDSSMTFSYYDQKTKYGYAGNSLSTLFPKFNYIVKLEHWSLLRDLWRFSRIGYRDLKSGYLSGKMLGEYCISRGFGEAFLNHYLYPMGAAIWSSPISQMQRFPAEPYINFLENHGLLRLINRPQWRYISGGSRNYVDAMLQDFRNTPQINAAPLGVRRHKKGVTILTKEGEALEFDQVVIATHADEALKLLIDPSDIERDLLTPWRYQENEVVLHTSTTYLPGNPKLWASWNFMRQTEHLDQRPVSVSYYMNRLQKLNTEQDYVVTLNPSADIPEKNVINRTILTHPLYTFESINTQPLLRLNNGRNHTWLCGSYFGYGFHEDAVCSAVDIAKGFGIEL